MATAKIEQLKTEKKTFLTIWTLATLVTLGGLAVVQANICFGPGLNQQGNWCGAGEGESRCPWYRNLLPHVPLTEDRCSVSTLYERPAEACSGDSDCCVGSYCCFSICEGIAKCYNPYTNEFTWTNSVKPCNDTKAPCPTPEPISTTTTTTTESTTTTTTTTEPPTTTTTSTTPDEECEYGCPIGPGAGAELPKIEDPRGR